MKKEAISKDETLELKERIKELTCLYKISQLEKEHITSIEDFLAAVVNILPAAWQHTELASAKITFGEQCFYSKNFRQGKLKQETEIIVCNENFGLVEVNYACNESQVAIQFLDWEEKLIEEIASDIASVIEKRIYLDENNKLNVQLRHADRLATIGQLAAGVAHEINEPLARILGFAQLAQRSEELPNQTQKDIDKIIKATLHARDVIRNLLLFSRQAISSPTQTNLNTVVSDSLFLFKARCQKEGIDLRLSFDPHLREITVDPSHIRQLLVNLTVNAIQAIEDSGTIDIITQNTSKGVMLFVKDTGVGIHTDQIDLIFDPFFTTKHKGIGTGIGLSVVKSIVSSYKGTISVDSEPNVGTTFSIFFPFGA